MKRIVTVANPTSRGASNRRAGLRLFGTKGATWALHIIGRGGGSSEASSAVTKS